MIHHTITFVAIATLQHVFVTFTMDINSRDAAIWSQTETTTDWQDHSSGTAYLQMAATETPEIFTKLASTVHNKLNVSLENLASAFNTSSYVGNCSDLPKPTDAYNFQYIPYDDVFTQELIRTVWELYGKYTTLIDTALYFICTENESVGHDVISMAPLYVHNFTEFMVRLNSSTETIAEMAALDTIADLYRTSIQQVESVMQLVKHLTDMILEEVKFYALKQIIIQQLEAINLFHQSSQYEIIVRKQMELVNSLQNISERAGDMSEHTDGNPFINVVTSSNISRFLDAQYWAKILEQETHVLFENQTKLHDVQHARFVMYKVAPVIVAIFLVVGMTSNGLLLTIFVRHKETRTLANSMLINLTIVDFLSLVVIGLLDYLRVIVPFYLGWLGCKLFTFFGFLLSTVSSYSVTMISVQRFIAFWQLSSLTWCHQSQKTKYVLIAIVWGIGCVLSVPHAVIANIESKIGNCVIVSLEVQGPLETADLIMFCVVPLLITAVSSGLTAYRIRSSARKIPGEVTGQEHLKHSRMVSSKVLFALTVLFVVSYTPFFLFKFLVLAVGIPVTTKTFVLVSMVTFCLRFLNSCLNPIVLFVMSRRYRGYIKRYCGQRNVQSAMKVEAVCLQSVNIRLRRR